MKEKILTTLLIINLLIAGILIGAPIEKTHTPIIIVTIIIFISYTLISNKPIKIIRNKIDIFVITMGIATLIPLVFHTAISITSSIEYVYKYISAILLYILIREQLVNYPETKKYIINTIVSISLILIILGIDNMSSKMFTNMLNTINIQIKEIEANRLSSIFCYANTLAIVIGISFILNINNYVFTKDKIKKNIYGIINTFLLTGLILTYSRLAILFIAIFIVFYLISLKDKLKIYDIIKLQIISLFLAFIYNSIFFHLINQEKYIQMWIFTLMILSINYFIISKTYKIEEKLETIKIKKVIIFSVVILIILFILVFTITGELDVFKKGRKEYQIQIGNITGNTEYTMQFELEEFDKENEFSIKVVEMDSFFDEIYTTEINKNEFLQNKKINITTQSTTDKIKIVFNKSEEKEIKLTIKNLTINGKNKIVDYKLLPDKLEERIENTRISQKGLTERIVFIQDGISLIKDNVILGHGGNAWEYLQHEYQQYFYYASQVHCYIVQIGIEYGITAVMAFIAIIIMAIKQFIKTNNKTDIASIFVALFLLMTHSLLDFNMTYLYVLQLFFILLAMLVSNSNTIREVEIVKNKKYFIAITVAIIGLAYICLNQYCNSETKQEEIKNLLQETYRKPSKELELDRKQIALYQQYFKLERHSIENQRKYFSYARLLLKDWLYLDPEESIQELEKVYIVVKNTESKYAIDYQIERLRECELIGDIIRLEHAENADLNELKNKFYSIIMDEYEEVKEYTQARNKNRLTQEEQNKYLEELEEIYDSSKKHTN